ncbi:hypothetical protein ALNOE001_21400 [Candidatus Methanobinarius endosymbioticus]|uniref:Uncharacterized protein n=1 Tax=Candidatus Methanobinarius endosymbioticus TaxID=2006182 RepID=A0A366M988_9EURY|nr:hypothetical protein ALNOE001_21400 [Candidatus Methanobinarius endosymbioticus]
MIKNYEEYKEYRSRLLTRGISIEESARLNKAMDEFEDNHPEIFEKLQREKWELPI